MATKAPAKAGKKKSFKKKEKRSVPVGVVRVICTDPRHKQRQG